MAYNDMAGGIETGVPMSTERGPLIPGTFSTGDQTTNILQTVTAGCISIGDQGRRGTHQKC